LQRRWDHALGFESQAEFLKLFLIVKGPGDWEDLVSLYSGVTVLEAVQRRTRREQNVESMIAKSLKEVL
jgi:hypothetical protein